MTTTTEADDRKEGPAAQRRAAWHDRAWWVKLARVGFGRSFWGFLAFAVVTGTVCYAIIGREAFIEALQSDLDLIGSLTPRIAIALTIAGLLWVLLPRDRVTALIGSESGLRGLVIATIAGMVTPGGPYSAYPLLAVLAASGADRGALIAYICSWATLGVQRVLVWDVPFMGADFSFVRVLVSLPLPIVAGLIARRLPFTLRLPTSHAEAGR
jgi:hypothetical protein